MPPTCQQYNYINERVGLAKNKNRFPFYFEKMRSNSWIHISINIISINITPHTTVEHRLCNDGLFFCLPVGGGRGGQSAPGDGECPDCAGQGRGAGLCLAGKLQQ